MERQPVKTIPIHEHLRPRLCDTYENDSIFDKFEVVFSGDAKNVMTGSYNNNFMIYPSDPDKEVEVVLQADKSAFKAKKVGVPTPINSSTSPTATNGGKKGGSRAGSPAAGAAGQGGRMRKETDADQIDFNKKILHMSWHPFEDSIAIAATNNVSMFLEMMKLANFSTAFRLLCIVEIGAKCERFSWSCFIGVFCVPGYSVYESLVPGFSVLFILETLS
jgi:serine/threonine-protein phosphatase 2A regulatory subunit B